MRRAAASRVATAAARSVSARMPPLGIVPMRRSTARGKCPPAIGDSAAFAQYKTTMILYMRAERTGGRRAAMTGAAVVMALGAWWLLEGTAFFEGSKEPPVQMPAPVAQQVQVPLPGPGPILLPEPRPVAVAPPPIQYFGQWIERSRRTVLLGYQGRSVVVPVPGRVDDRYEVLAADERQLVLRDLATASTLHIALGSAPLRSAGTAMPPVRDDAATLTSVVPREPQLPSTSKRDEDEPEN